MNELDSYYVGYQEIIRGLNFGYHPYYLEKSASKTLKNMVEVASTGYYNGEYLTKYVKVKK